ncbi:unnamed protein product [Periconia digitata]|uniref:Uncharacterized protein n=1 Tax=Periconia digitata TaxID=1303443 RepID=A0A9W4XGZ6_9PLEO|nr:unnamed protein product [Periconia digitata]
MYPRDPNRWRSFNTGPSRSGGDFSSRSRPRDPLQLYREARAYAQDARMRQAHQDHAGSHRYGIPRETRYEQPRADTSQNYDPLRLARSHHPMMHPRDVEFGSDIPDIFPSGFVGPSLFRDSPFGDAPFGGSPFGRPSFGRPPFNQSADAGRPRTIRQSGPGWVSETTHFVNGQPHPDMHHTSRSHAFRGEHGDHYPNERDRSRPYGSRRRATHPANVDPRFRRYHPNGEWFCERTGKWFDVVDDAGSDGE